MAASSLKAGQYFIKRALTDPSDNLQRQIFPEIEEWKDRLAQGQIEQSLSAIGFLKLLTYFRTVILQDAPSLIAHYPNLFIWNHKYYYFKS